MANDIVRLKIHHQHDWDLAPAEAREVQERLESFVLESPLPKAPESIAGVDVGIKDNRVRAVVAVVSFPDLELIDHAAWEGLVTFPYIPGYLSFREVPVLLRALERLESWPDLFMTDGQGRAHPRRFGLACHLGVLLDAPTVGVAKSRLTGIHEQPCDEKGCSTPLLDPKGEEAIGAVVRTRAKVKPVFVSVGHRVTLGEAVELTLACSPRFKIPEPTRQAHRLSREWGYGARR